jgi:hypothetical protein
LHDERPATGRGFDPAFRDQLVERREDRVPVDPQRLRELAAAREAMSRPQAAPLDVGRQGPRNLEERRESRPSVEIHDELPSAARHPGILTSRTGPGNCRISQGVIRPATARIRPGAAE